MSSETTSDARAQGDGEGGETPARSLRWFSVADQAVMSLVNFLITVLVARYGGAELLGEYVLLYGVAFLVHRLHAAVVCMPMATEVPRDRCLVGRFARCHAGFVAVALPGVAALALAVLVLVVGRTPAPAELALVAVGVAGFISQEFARRHRLALGEGARAVMLAAGFGLILLAAVTIAGESGRLDVGAIFLGFFVAALPALIGTARFGRSLLYLRSNVALAWAKAGAEIGLVIGNGVQWLSAQLVYYLVAVLAGTTAVGVLAAVRNLFGPLHVLILSIEGHLPRALAGALDGDGIRGVRRGVRRETLFVLIGMVPVGVGALAFGAPVVEWLYGSSLGSYATHVMLLAFVLVYGFAFLTRICIVGLRVLDRQGDVGRCTAISLVPLAIAGAVLVPAYAATGGAWTMVIGEGAMLLLMARALAAAARRPR